MSYKNQISIKRETNQARAAYAVYRDLGERRSTALVGKALGKSKELMERWSAAHHWVERARAHDAALAAEAAEASKQRRLQEMQQRHEDRLKVAAASRGKGVTGLQTLAPASISDVVRLFDYADKTERLEYGQATERYDVRNLSTAELIAERDLLEAAARRDSGGAEPAHGGAAGPLA